MRYYGYDEFLRDMKSLKQILSGNDIDTIVFALRGGATMAHLLSLGMDIKNVFAINASSYDGKLKLGAPIISNIPDLPEGSKKVLLVDEIIDSGETMTRIFDTLQVRYPNIKFVTACIFQRPSSPFKADFFIQTTDEWIDFFWERDLC